ncbi:MAG: hypothetical protein PHY80_03425 [Rickettsiales bacterium]|nr:hypothetical protein [Rickettsiales bacterium]
MPFRSERLLENLGSDAFTLEDHRKEKSGDTFFTIKSQPNIKPEIKISVKGKFRSDTYFHFMRAYDAFYLSIEIDGQEIFQEDCDDSFKVNSEGADGLNSFLERQFGEYTSFKDLISKKMAQQEKAPSVDQVEKIIQLDANLSQLSVIPTDVVEDSEKIQRQALDEQNNRQLSDELPFRDLSQKELQEEYSEGTEEQSFSFPVEEESHTSRFDWLNPFKSSSDFSEQVLKQFNEEKKRRIKDEVNQFVLLFNAKCSGRQLSQWEVKIFNDFLQKLLSLANESNRYDLLIKRKPQDDLTLLFARTTQQEFSLYLSELKKHGLELNEEDKETYEEYEEVGDEDEVIDDKKQKKDKPAEEELPSHKIRPYSFSLKKLLLPLLAVSGGFLPTAAAMVNSTFGYSTALTVYNPINFGSGIIPVYPSYPSSNAISGDGNFFGFGLQDYLGILQQQLVLRNVDGLTFPLVPYRHISSSTAISTFVVREPQYPQLLPKMPIIPEVPRGDEVVVSLQQHMGSLSSNQVIQHQMSVELPQQHISGLLPRDDEVVLSQRQSELPILVSANIAGIIPISPDIPVSLPQQKLSLDQISPLPRNISVDSSLPTPSLQSEVSSSADSPKLNSSIKSTPSSEDLDIDDVSHDSTSINKTNSVAYSLVLYRDAPQYPQSLPNMLITDSSPTPVNIVELSTLSLQSGVQPQQVPQPQAVIEESVRDSANFTNTIVVDGKDSESGSSSFLGAMVLPAVLGVGMATYAAFKNKTPDKKKSDIDSSEESSLASSKEGKKPEVEKIPKTPESGNHSEKITPSSEDLDLDDASHDSTSVDKTNSATPSLSSSDLENYDAIAEDIIDKAQVSEEQRKGDIRKKAKTISGRADLYVETISDGCDISCFERLEDSTRRYLVLAKTAENGTHLSTTEKINQEEARRIALGQSAKTEQEAKTHVSCIPDEIRYPNGEENVEMPFVCSSTLNDSNQTVLTIKVLDPALYVLNHSKKIQKTYEIILEENQVFYDVLCEINEKGLNTFLNGKKETGSRAK